MWLAIYQNGFDGYELHAYDNYKSDAIESLYQAIQLLPYGNQEYRGKKITRQFIRENASFHKFKLGNVLHSTNNLIMEF
jgi:hypothetical protein